MESFLPLKKYGMDFRFSGNNINIECALHLMQGVNDMAIKFHGYWSDGFRLSPEVVMFDYGNVSLWTNVRFFKSEAAVTVRPKSVSCSKTSHKNELLYKYYFNVKYRDICHLKLKRYFFSYLLRF